MGGPHIFGFTGTLRKTKPVPLRPLPQTSIESDLRRSGKAIAYQRENGAYTMTGALGRQEEHSQLGVVGDLDPGLPSVPATDMATNGVTPVAAGNEELGTLLYTVHKKASSQILGSQNYELSHNSVSGANQTSQSLREYGSSSTLRSFYDPQKIPLAVSQQTSNSSARDFALRKGCPPVVTIDKRVSRLSQSRKAGDAALLQTRKKTSPGRLDLSMLFPKPSAHHDHLVSSQIGKGLAAEVLDQTVISPVVPLGPSTGQKHKSNIANLNKAPSHLRRTKDPDPLIAIPEQSKMSFQRLNGGVKHWFDAFEDEDLEFGNQHESVRGRRPPESSRPPDRLPAKPKTDQQNLKPVSLYNKMYEPTARSNQPHPQASLSTDPRAISPARVQRVALQSPELRSTHQRTTPAKKGATHIRKNRINPFNSVNLLTDSVLWISSSDDDSEADDSLQSDISTIIPGIRDSLIVAPSDSDVEIGTAHAIKTKRPKLERESPLRKSQHQALRNKEFPLKAVDVPERQSSRIFSFQSDQSRFSPNSREDSFATAPMTATSSELVGDQLHSSSTTSRKQTSLSRLMTVTAQEESLLEALRSKRASMRQSIVAESFRRTSSGEEGERNVSPVRPRSSGREGNSASFLHLSQDSVPTLSTFQGHRRSISAGEVLEFSGVEHRNSHSTDPLNYRRDSSAFSSLPSSSSQESPPTPTLELLPDDSVQSTSANRKRYPTLPTDYQDHNRVRTGSSAVIVLDNSDDNSSIQFKQVDLPIWAFDEWTGRRGLAIVH